MRHLIFIIALGCATDPKEPETNNTQVDIDGDGFTNDVDCNDDNPDINPGA